MASYDDTATVSGSVVGFSNGADSVPLKNWLVTLPASLDGYTEVNGYKANTNFYDDKHLNVGLPATAIGSSIDTINTTATRYTYNGFSSPRSNIAIKGSRNDTSVVGACLFFGYSGGFLTEYRSINPFGSSAVVIDCSSFDYVRISIGAASGYQAPTDMTAYGYMSAEYGTAFTEYTPADTKQYTASLGRTIYGGQADIVNGEGSDSYDKGSMTSTYLSGLSSSYIGYEASLAYFGGHAGVWVRNWNYQTAAARTAGGIGAVCNHFPISFNNSDIFASQYRVYFDVDGKNISSVQDFIDYVSTLEQNNDSLDIVYELATATAFTFTPITPTPETAKGSNTFWSDNGNTELTYYKDGYGFTSVTIHKETPDGEPVEETRKLHRIIYEGQVDVINGTGLIYRGESGTQYDPPEQISFTPIEVSTDEGENTLYADQGDSAITYRKEI